jgi:hypothetical protein
VTDFEGAQITCYIYAYNPHEIRDATEVQKTPAIKFKQEDCLAAPLCPHTHHSLNSSEQQLNALCEGNE